MLLTIKEISKKHDIPVRTLKYRAKQLEIGKVIDKRGKKVFSEKETLLIIKPLKMGRPKKK